MPAWVRPLQPLGETRGRCNVYGMDRDGAYGWISIALHWLAAAAVLALLFAGDSIAVAGTGARDVHTTLGLCVWILLAARIAWRLYQRHPARVAGQGWFAFHAGLVVHYILLAAIAMMLVSGPLAAWASGAGMNLFALHLPGAAAFQPEVYAVSRTLHVSGAVALAVGTVLHVAGVLKHMFVDRDNMLDRIMVPPERPD